MSDEKKCVICLALTIIMGFLLFYTYIGDTENEHRGIIRLHVIANSNSAEDQALKLQVRDGVIAYMEKHDNLANVDEARAFLRGDLNRLETIADGIIAAEGYDYTAAADLGVRYIPEKTYGEITFPAGNYEALNITIGSGEGENWWCVLFPPLCLLDEGTEAISNDDLNPSAGEATSISGEAASDSDETPSASDEIIPGSDEELQLYLRWKLMELLQKD